MFRWLFKTIISIIVLITAVLIFGTYFYFDGLPSSSDYIINKLPKSLSVEISKELRNEILSKHQIDDYKTDKINAFTKELNFGKNIKVYVIKSNKFNAFALPHKYIFVYSKTLDRINNYEELAALLSHEYTHIEKNHGLRSIGRSFGYKIFSGIFFSKKFRQKIMEKSNLLLNLKYSRQFEKEADLNAINLLEKNKIDPNGMLQLLKTMKKYVPNRNLNDKLSDHPNIYERIEYIEEAINNEKTYPVNEKLENIFMEIKKRH